MYSQHTPHIPQHIFREYDIRGLVGSDLTAETALHLGRVLGSMVIGNNNQCLAVVGRDGRHSSPELSLELTRGLSQVGIKVMDIGVVATPILYFSSQMMKADLAIMVTGSHNPSDYNGFKIVIHNKPFFGPELQGLYHLMVKSQWNLRQGMVIESETTQAYLDHIISDLYYKQPTSDLRIGWDSGNGAMGPVLEALLPRLPGTHFHINAELDGDFPNHHPDPAVEANLMQLKELVKAKHLDIGFAFDGDGDRLGMITSEGEVIWGDQILLILAKACIGRYPPQTPILVDIKASQMIYDALARLGAKPIFCPSGHSRIKAKMQETKAPLAGEMSGHIFIKDRYLGFDDSLYAALRLMEIFGQTPNALKDILSSLPKSAATPEIRILCPDEVKFSKINELSERLAGYDEGQIIRIDGLRVMESKGWWLVRASNTQPALVLRCEAKNQLELKQIVNRLINRLDEVGIDSSPLQDYSVGN